MAGRPRKPIEMKILEATWRADRDGIPSDIGASGEPDHGGVISGDAADIWDAVVPGLVKIGVAKECDTSQLVAMCEWWARYRRWAEALDTSEPGKETHSLMVQVGIAWTNFDKLASRFGLTPSDRAKMRVDTRKPQGAGIMSRKRQA